MTEVRSGRRGFAPMSSPSRVRRPQPLPCFPARQREAMPGSGHPRTSALRAAAAAVLECRASRRRPRTRRIRAARIRSAPFSVSAATLGQDRTASRGGCRYRALRARPPLPTCRLTAAQMPRCLTAELAAGRDRIEASHWHGAIRARSHRRIPRMLTRERPRRPSARAASAPPRAPRARAVPALPGCGAPCRPHSPSNSRRRPKGAGCRA